MTTTTTTPPRLLALGLLLLLLQPMVTRAEDPLINVYMRGGHDRVCVFMYVDVR